MSIQLPQATDTMLDVHCFSTCHGSLLWWYIALRISDHALLLMLQIPSSCSCIGYYVVGNDHWLCQNQRLFRAACFINETFRVHDRQQGDSRDISSDFHTQERVCRNIDGYLFCREHTIVSDNVRRPTMSDHLIHLLRPFFYALFFFSFTSPTADVRLKRMLPFVSLR